MMETRRKRWRDGMFFVFGAIASALLTLQSSAPALAEPRQPADIERLAGTWLFDAASRNNGSDLSVVWTSKLTVAENSFVLSKFFELPKDLRGKFVLDPTANPKTIDLSVEEFDLSEAGAPMKIPACTLPGIYKRDDDRLTICFASEVGGKRPTAFDIAGGQAILLTLVNADDKFTGFPKEVTVKVSGPDGKPAAGVTVATFMSRYGQYENEKKGKDIKQEWKYSRPVKTGTDGTVKLKYEDLRYNPVVVRDPENKRMAMAATSPAKLVNGTVSVILEPECHLTGTIVCPELKKAGKPVGWTNVYALCEGRRAAMCDSVEGRFEFVLPPGTYTLHAYGSDLKKKYVTVVAPKKRSEFTVAPIALMASKRVLLEGRPAPQLEGVVGWKGEPVKLADLKGKYVLLEFWGYWCGPCVGAMPVLIELHEKYADKGLTIIGVHADIDGEVDTAAKLDEKIAGYKKKHWKGKDVPFPVALTSGKLEGEGDAKARGGPAGQYGVLSWPTTILIDRDGKVVGTFGARDVKAASERIEKLLAKKKAE